ncbi:unnamed protein product [Paramecium octaurelia]|uniref:Transmembrane protein n=1 Tax=Paramecium octaurelia TaxID=43137 RepID=A0A8S1YHN5_PAROT|nr:unnamed protein product [Paramecium octaurelia]
MLKQQQSIIVFYLIVMYILISSIIMSQLLKRLINNIQQMQQMQPQITNMKSRVMVVTQLVLIKISTFEEGTYPKLGFILGTIVQKKEQIEMQVCTSFIGIILILIQYLQMQSNLIHKQLQKCQKERKMIHYQEGEVFKFSYSQLPRQFC